ncbi:hypothetical protein LWI29_016885 [Acer saccharum]|uniref:DUF4220 domain-containing protein n=1 Tax=Acer saccharum TaxID=4024 RepID=A0AA39W1B7_ACESA|nr:hypothetical protein LWI29_016885 [Acer saccharum]
MLKEEHSGEKSNTSPIVQRDRLDDVQVVHYAYHYFEIFKGLIVDLIFSFQERNESRNFFHSLSPEDALRVIEVELNFIYEALYTKVQVVHSKFGYFTRFISFALVVASLSLFHFKVKKSGFDEINVVITYALFLGAIALDTVAFFMLIFSDWTFAVLYDPKNGSKMLRKFKSCIAATIGWFLIFKRPRCYEHEKHSCKVLATPFLLRRWSGHVSGYNLIRYCLKGRPTNFDQVRDYVYRVTEKIIPGFIGRKDIRFIGNGVSQFLSFINAKVTHLINKFIDCFGLTGFMDEIRYVSHEPLTKELWEFIFTELRDKSISAEDPEVAKKISSARGNSILDNKTHLQYLLLPYLNEVTYDESLLLWHIATELLYLTEEEVTSNNNNGPDEEVTGNDKKADSHKHREFNEDSNRRRRDQIEEEEKKKKKIRRIEEEESKNQRIEEEEEESKSMKKKKKIR